MTRSAASLIALALASLIALGACGGGSSTPPADAPPGAPPDAPATSEPYRCDFAACEGGVARTCDDSDPQTLACADFGATCGAFTDTDSGQPFRWCSCGTLGESEGFCTGGRYGVTCVGGLGGLADCGPGFVCAARPAGPFGIGCDCNNAADGICPSTSCAGDPDCATCTPDCTGKACGDNGCGGSCGSCDLGEVCSDSDQCEATCAPDCDGKVCGDDGCGGSCGTCDGTCTASGQCEGACVPSCTDRTCGSDGCGGSCGSCDSDLECGSRGSCACPFFELLNYRFTLPPEGSFPAMFQGVTLNVRHIGIDGVEHADGAFMGFRTNDVQTFTMRVYGCRPHIKIKREYLVNFRSCVSEAIYTGRETFTIPPPVVNPDGSCTAPPL